MPNARAIDQPLCCGQQQQRTTGRHKAAGLMEISERVTTDCKLLPSYPGHHAHLLPSSTSSQSGVYLITPIARPTYLLANYLRLAAALATTVVTKLMIMSLMLLLYLFTFLNFMYLLFYELAMTTRKLLLMG